MGLSKLPRTHRLIGSLLSALLLLMLGGTSAFADGSKAFAGVAGQQSYRVKAADISSDDEIITVPFSDQALRFTITSESRHNNGDRSMVLEDAGEGWSGTMTLGSAGAFGNFHSASGHRVLSTDGSGSWLIELPHTGVSFNQCATAHPGTRVAKKTTSSSVQQRAAAFIDLLLIYNGAFADRYPGALLETRLNHLVHIANATAGNSGLDLAFRIVGSAFYPYRNDNSNQEFRDDIAESLAGNTRPGLNGLAAQRDALGADLVIGLRPHDIETRGSCGIAFFPDDDASRGANVVSDGSSSWSFCLDDVLTHEIGHNLGATHQLGAGGGVVDPRGSAFVRDGRFTTVMGSFGTGRADRFRGLQMFSNPDLACGNEPCGDPVDKNNVAVIRSLVSEVAAYRSASSNLPVPEVVPRSNSDSDGDGVNDWNDALPFDATETRDSDFDGRGDNNDAFPTNAQEQDDSDGDLVGNNADPDDDGDGVTDGNDAFPLDASESRDTDRDGVGDNADHFAADFRDFRDSDRDGVGDNSDEDADNDGVLNFAASRQDLLVISTGNSQILRFDAATGRSRGVEVPAWDSLLTFQSSMVYRRVDQTLVYTGNSGLRRVDLRNRGALGEWVAPFGDSFATPSLASGFPVSIAALNEGERLLVAALRDPVLRGFRGRELALIDSSNGWQLDASDTPGDATASGNVAFVLGTGLNAIYRLSDQGSGFLAGPGLGWLGTPRRIISSGDGRLLISDRSRNAVVAVDQDSGRLINVLAELDTSGHSRPEGLAVTSQGELLVAAAAQDAILAFDATTGAYLGQRILPGAGGLESPGDILLVPALEDRFATDPQRQIRPNPGLWFDPASDGRGFDVQYYGDRLSVIWYTYDQQGLPTWYLAAGALAGTRFEGAFNRFSLGPDEVLTGEVVGALTLEFGSERLATASWTIDGISASEQLQWLQFSPMVREQDNTGLWGREDGPGWGVSLASQGGTSVAVAYIYDDAGTARWVISNPVSGPAPYDFPMLASFAPGLCPGCTADAGQQLIAAGSMRLEVPEASRWNSNINLPGPLQGAWQLNSTEIRLFSEPSTRPR